MHVSKIQQRSAPQVLSRLAHTVRLNEMHVVGLCPASTWPGEGSPETSFWREKTCRVSPCRVHQVGFVGMRARVTWFSHTAYVWVWVCLVR